VFTITKQKNSYPFPELDQRCGEILLRLIIIGRKIGFNELLENLKKTGSSFTKPTLSSHLKHLREEKLVIRRLEDVHKVSYEINHEQYAEFESYVLATVRPLLLLAEQEKKFYSLNTDNQLDFVLQMMLRRGLHILTTKIELELDPTRKAEKTLILQWLKNPVFEHYERLLTEKCKTEPQFGKEVLNKIYSMLKKNSNKA
jgi:DNA-binding transcriptional ArsR family regulator